MLRKVVRIDEARCDGCGECIGSCAEGAIALVGGKARLVSDVYCDGLGACLGECPQGAISVEEREADAFDEAAVGLHLERMGRAPLAPPATATAPAMPRAPRAHDHAGCPGSAAREIPRRSLSVLKDAPVPAAAPAPRQGGSTLAHWPVQLTLVPPHAPWLAGADLLVAADCVPFALAGFHEQLLKGKAVVVGCPKLDDVGYYTKKLAQIFSSSGARSVTVATMEVPCCSGLVKAVYDAMDMADRSIPVYTVTVGIRGQVLDEVRSR